MSEGMPCAPHKRGLKKALGWVTLRHAEELFWMNLIEARFDRRFIHKPARCQAKETSMDKAICCRIMAWREMVYFHAQPHVKNKYEKEPSALYCADEIFVSVQWWRLAPIRMRWNLLSLDAALISFHANIIKRWLKIAVLSSCMDSLWFLKLLKNSFTEKTLA